MKPHSAVGEYFRAVEALLGALGDAYIESYAEELLTGDRANLHASIERVLAEAGSDSR